MGRMTDDGPQSSPNAHGFRFRPDLPHEHPRLPERDVRTLSPRDTAESWDRRAELAGLTRPPVGRSCCSSSGMAWLLVGTLFALIASYKLHSPEFLNQYAWLTFRTHPRPILMR